MDDQGKDFLHKLARPRPDPGGGAAAAYCGLLALALMEKIVHLERRRKRELPELDAFWFQMLDAIRTSTKEFHRLLHEDVEAYGRLDKAMVEGDKDKLLVAVEDAIKCPMQMMVNSQKALADISSIGKKCKKHLVADLMVAAEMLGAVLQGAFHIASANLPLMKRVSNEQVFQSRLQNNLTHGLRSLESTKKDLAARS